MQKYLVRFNGIHNKESFIKATNIVPYEIDLEYGNTVVDGKSAIGVYACPDKTPIRCTFHTDTEDIKNKFKMWIVTD